MAASTCRVLQSAQIEVSVFFIISKDIFVSFFKRKICRDKIRKNIKEYIHKKKKITIDLRTTSTSTFLSAIIHENAT